MQLARPFSTTGHSPFRSCASHAKQVAIQEVRRLQRFGVTRGELERYKTALLRDRCAAVGAAICVAATQGGGGAPASSRLQSAALVGLVQRRAGTACKPVPSPLPAAHWSAPAASSWLSRARACPAWTTWSL